MKIGIFQGPDVRFQHWSCLPKMQLKLEGARETQCLFFFLVSVKETIIKTKKVTDGIGEDICEYILDGLISRINKECTQLNSNKKVSNWIKIAESGTAFFFQRRHFHKWPTGT